LQSASVLLNTDVQRFAALERNSRCSVVKAAINPPKSCENNQQTTKPETLGGLIAKNLSRTPGDEGVHVLEPTKFNPGAALTSPATTSNICKKNNDNTYSTTEGHNGLLLICGPSLDIGLEGTELCLKILSRYVWSIRHCYSPFARLRWEMRLNDIHTNSATTINVKK
jgi:hypothetical protein